MKLLAEVSGALERGELILQYQPQIGPLTLTLIDQAIGQLVTSRKVGIDVQMSVNPSPRNLVDAELPQQIADILKHHCVAPDRLVVEVTESAAMDDPRRAVATLAALRATGTGISVDAFGTDNASIEYLAKLPATEIKDRQVVHH